MPEGELSAGILAATKDELDKQREATIGDAIPALAVTCAVDEGEDRLVVEVGTGAKSDVVSFTREMIAQAVAARPVDDAGLCAGDRAAMARERVPVASGGRHEPAGG